LQKATLTARRVHGGASAWMQAKPRQGRGERSLSQTEERRSRVARAQLPPTLQRLHASKLSHKPPDGLPASAPLVQEWCSQAWGHIRFGANRAADPRTQELPYIRAAAGCAGTSASPSRAAVHTRLQTAWVIAMNGDISSAKAAACMPRAVQHTATQVVGSPQVLVHSTAPWPRRFVLSPCTCAWQHPPHRPSEPCRRNDVAETAIQQPVQLSIRDDKGFTAERSVLSVGIRAKGNCFGLLWQVAWALQSGCPRKEETGSSTKGNPQPIVSPQGCGDK
jgi:hypothetical protein